MFVPLTKSIVSCLDRGSALRLARLKPDPEILKRMQELEEKQGQQTLSATEQAEMLVISISLEMLADLHLEARSFLRRPAGATPASKKR